jgi:TolB-like protein
MIRGYRVPVVELLVFLGIIISPARAGQVITDDARQWAKNAIKQEQTLEIVSAPNTVAVLPFHNRSANPQLNPLQKGFAFLLITDLAQVEGISIVERIRLQALVEELGIGASGLVEKDSAPRVGKLLGAGYLVGGDLSSSQQTELGILSDLLQVKDQNSLGRPSADGRLAQVFDLEKKVLFEIIALLKVKLTKQQMEKLKKPLTTSYEALISLSLGLDASDRGNYTGAAYYYHKALDEDPKFLPAQGAIQELMGLGLVPAKPRSRAALLRQEEQNSSTTTLGKNSATFREFRPETEGQIRVTW